MAKGQRILKFQNSEDFLTFEFKEERGNVSCYFTGIPQGNYLLEIEDGNILKAFRYYINNERFSFLRDSTIKPSTLSFGGLKISTEGSKIEFLSSELLPFKVHKGRTLYISEESSLLLWIIVSAEEGFDPEKARRVFLRKGLEKKEY